MRDGNGIKAPAPSGEGKLMPESRDLLELDSVQPCGPQGIFFQKGEMRPGVRKFMLGPGPVQRISAHVSEHDLKTVTEDSEAA